MRSKLQTSAALVSAAVVVLGVFYPPTSAAVPLQSSSFRVENAAPRPPENLLAAASNKCWNYKPTERGFARFHNAERADDGTNKLRLDPELSKVARLHTRRMVKADNLFHTPDFKLMGRVKDWSVLGENVGVGGSVESLHDAFMASPGHRANIMWETFRYFGIGVRETEDRMWVTVIFEAAKNPGTRLRMPKC